MGRSARMVRYEVLSEDRLQPSDAERITALLAQLSENARQISRDDLLRILRQERLWIVVARADGGAIIGMATLTVFEKLSAREARVDDVVVDERFRNQGIGEALNRRLMEIAGTFGAHFIELTSSAERRAAHALYRKLGYRERSTQVFRRTFERHDR